MKLSDLGVTGQPVDLLNGGDVDTSGRLLSAAEIQQAFRDLRRQRAAESFPAALHTSSPSEIGAVRRTTAASAGTLHTSQQAAADAPKPPSHTCAAGRKVMGRGADRLHPGWVVVVAAHSGAGASCVALALADAYSATGRRSRLIEAACPSRSGLISAAEAELGLDASGAWQHGSRQLATIYRRAGERAPDRWPSGESEATVVDLGLPSLDNIPRLIEDEPRLVVACRVSVPGLRLTEHMLTQLAERAAVVAAVGNHRWPGDVTASLGPRLRQLQEQGQVVCVPEDRRLCRTGLTRVPLPRSIAAAGRALLSLLDAAPSVGPTTAAQPAPARKD